jgi:hypothetical protein
MATYLPTAQFGAAADALAVTDALARAAGTAGYAPSIHNELVQTSFVLVARG